MCIKYLNLTTENIILSILDYYPNREKETTKIFFLLGNEKFPVMNIIKRAMEINGGYESKDYDNLSCCKNILKERLDLSDNSFIKISNDK